MRYCINCGIKIENEEMICVNCGTNMGKLLKKNTGDKVIVGRGNEIFNQITKVVKESFVSPVTSVINNSKEINITLSLTLMFLISSIFGAISTWGYERFFSWVVGINDNIMKLQQDRGSINTSVRESIQSNSTQMINRIKLRPEKVFVIGFIAIILAMVSAYALSYLIGRFLFKAKFNAIQLLNVIVLSSLPLMGSLILMIVFNYISSMLALIPLIIGVTIYSICLFKGIGEIMKIDENKVAILVPITYIAIMLVSYNYFLKLFSKYVTVAYFKNILQFIFSSTLY
jgi:hypothetical protein